MIFLKGLIKFYHLSRGIPYDTNNDRESFKELSELFISQNQIVAGMWT